MSKLTCEKIIQMKYNGLRVQTIFLIDYQNKKLGSIRGEDTINEYLSDERFQELLNQEDYLIEAHFYADIFPTGSYFIEDEDESTVDLFLLVDNTKIKITNTTQQESITADGQFIRRKVTTTFDVNGIMIQSDNISSEYSPLGQYFLILEEELKEKFGLRVPSAFLLEICKQKTVIEKLRQAHTHYKNMMNPK